MGCQLYRNYVSHIASCAFAGVVIIASESTGSGQEPSRPYEVKGIVQSHAISSTGKSLVISDGVGGVFIYDISDVARPKQTDKMKHPRVASVAISPDGKLLASVGMGQLKIWQMSTRSEKETIRDNAEPSIVLFSPDGKLIATTGQSGKFFGKVKIREVGSFEEKIALGENVGPFPKLAFSQNKYQPLLLAVGWRDTSSLSKTGTIGMIKVWEVASGKEKATFKGRGSNGLVFSQDGKKLISASSQLTMYDMGLEEEPVTLFSDPVGGVALSPDGKTIAFSTEAKLKLVSLETQKEIAEIDLLSPTAKGTLALCTASFTPNGQAVFLGGYSGGQIWDVSKFVGTAK